MLRILKALGVLTDNGAPTEHYDRLRDQNNWKYVLAERIRNAYSELYAIDERIHAEPENEVKGALSRVTGKDETMVSRYYATFKTLAGLAKFDSAPQQKERAATERAEETPTSPERPLERIRTPLSDATSFRYNIQIHLPATTDVAVYNAIFKTLREHLLI